MTKEDSSVKIQLLLDNIESQFQYRKIEFDIANQFKNGFVKINPQKGILTIHFTNESHVREDIELIKSIILKNNPEIEIIEREEIELFRKVLILEGLDCANCAAKIERIAKRNFSHEFLTVDLATSRFIIETADEALINDITDKVQEIASSVDNKIVVHSQLKKVNSFQPVKITNKKLIKFICGFSIFIVAVILKYVLKQMFDGEISFYVDKAILLMHFIGYVLLGGDVLYGAFKNIKSGRIFDENFLMSLATITALFIGYYEEAVSVMIFYKIGDLLQEYAVNRSRNSIRELIGIHNAVVNIEVKGEILEVDPLEVFVGDIMIIKPGEKYLLMERLFLVHLH